MSENDNIWSGGYVAVCKEIDRLRMLLSVRDEEARSASSTIQVLRTKVDSLTTENTSAAEIHAAILKTNSNLRTENATLRELLNEVIESEDLLSKEWFEKALKQFKEI